MRRNQGGRPFLLSPPTVAGILTILLSMGFAFPVKAEAQTNLDMVLNFKTASPMYINLTEIRQAIPDAIYASWHVVDLDTSVLRAELLGGPYEFLIFKPTSILKGNTSFQLQLRDETSVLVTKSVGISFDIGEGQYQSLALPSKGSVFVDIFASNITWNNTALAGLSSIESPGYKAEMIVLSQERQRIVLEIKQAIPRELNIFLNRSFVDSTISPYFDILGDGFEPRYKIGAVYYSVKLPENSKAIYLERTRTIVRNETWGRVESFGTKVERFSSYLEGNLSVDTFKVFNDRYSELRGPKKSLEFAFGAINAELVSVAAHHEERVVEDNLSATPTAYLEKVKDPTKLLTKIKLRDLKSFLQLTPDLSSLIRDYNINIDVEGMFSRDVLNLDLEVALFTATHRYEDWEYLTFKTRKIASNANASFYLYVLDPAAIRYDFGNNDPQGFRKLADRTYSDVSVDLQNARINVYGDRRDAKDEILYKNINLLPGETGSLAWSTSPSFALRARWKTTQQGNWQSAFPIFVKSSSGDAVQEANSIYVYYYSRDSNLRQNPYYFLQYRDSGNNIRINVQVEAVADSEYRFLIYFDAFSNTLTMKMFDSTGVLKGSGSYTITSASDGFSLSYFGVATKGASLSQEPPIRGWVDDIFWNLQSTVSHDDKGRNGGVYLDHSDDYARKWFDISALPIQYRSSAKLWIYGRAFGTDNNVKSHKIVVNDVSSQYVEFDPYDYFPAGSYVWAGFDIPLSWLGGTSNKFEIKDKGGPSGWTYQNLEIGKDTNNDKDMSEWIDYYDSCRRRANCVGELMIRLELSYDSDGDSITDHDEVLQWTDPLGTDTDSDGTPDNLDYNPTFDLAVGISILRVKALNSMDWGGWWDPYIRVKIADPWGAWQWLHSDIPFCPNTQECSPNFDLIQDVPDSSRYINILIEMRDDDTMSDIWDPPPDYVDNGYDDPMDISRKTGGWLEGWAVDLTFDAVTFDWTGDDNYPGDPNGKGVVSGDEDGATGADATVWFSLWGHIEMGATEKRNLVDKYSPIMYFHKDEQYYPIDIWAQLDQSNLRRKSDNGVVDAKPIAETSLVTYYSYGYYIDDDLTPEQRPGAQTGYTRIIYAHVFTTNEYKVIIQYWFFYLFNKGRCYPVWPLCAPDHEGDWEMIQLRLPSPNQDPEAVAYSWHYDVLAESWSSILKEGNHPYVKVELDSHASDIVHSTSEIENYLRSTYPGLVLNVQKWLRFQGNWGLYQNLAGYGDIAPSGPRGPVFRHSGGCDGGGADQRVMWIDPIYWSNHGDQCPWPP